jgi:hypothetical protein
MKQYFIYFCEINVELWRFHYIYNKQNLGYSWKNVTICTAEVRNIPN